MALPAEETKITVTGKWEHLHDGTPVAGSVTFDAEINFLNDTVSNVQLVPDSETATLDGSGAFSVPLTPGNLAANAQIGWTWRCTFALTGVAPAHVPPPFSFAVDKDTPGGVLQMASVIPATPSAGSVQLITGPAGLGVSSATVNSSDNLVLTMSDASTVTAGLPYVRKASIPANAVEHSVDNTGVTDCTTSLQAFLNTMATTDQVARLYGTFAISSTITLISSVDASGAVFNYTGSGVAVQIGPGTSAAAFSRVTIHLPRVVCLSKPGTGWTAGTVGVKMVNVNSSFIWVPHIQNFETGLWEWGNNQGNVYNDVFLGHLDNNKVNQLLDGNTGGWCNQNAYYGGRFSHNSGEGSLVAGTRHVLLTDTPTTTTNNNIWVNPSLESPGVVEHVIEVLGGVNNLWDKARFEWSGTGGPTVVWGADAVHNRIRAAHHGDNITETFTAGASRNDLDADTWRRETVSGTKGVILENAFSTSSPVLLGLRAGGTAAGDDPTTAYAWRGSGSNWGFKRFGDAFDRVLVDSTNSQVLVGAGTATPAVGLTRNGPILPTFTTSARNSLTPVAGQTVFDTTLHFLVTYDGTVWRNGAGTAV